MNDDESGVLAALPAHHRERLLTLARQVRIPADSTVFDEDEPAERFWILRAGRVALDFHVPGHGLAVVETLGPGELLGWSWLFEPFQWHLGARVREEVSAYEFDATAVRGLIDVDAPFGLAVTTCVAKTIGDRLRACRARLLDMYAPDSLEPARGGTFL